MPKTKARRKKLSRPQERTLIAVNSALTVLKALRDTTVISDKKAARAIVELILKEIF